MIGTTIGRYRILAKLGEGGMGTVWKAQHTLLPDRLAALKLLSESLWESEEARQRFLREAIAVSKLDHPRIAPLYDADYVDGRLCIAFKFIDGETVARKTEAGPLPLGEAVAIAADAASALAHAHARGVLHRDVSAGNIMIDREGHGVLVDFGLARSGVETQLTRTGTTLGTLAYMAPEVLRGGADPRSDLYGLGAVLYRMVTGRPLFAADSTEAVQYKVLNEVPRAPSELRPGVPPALDDLILRLLEKQPGDRYASAEGVLEQLERVRELPAIVAERTEPIAVPWRARWPRRWRRVVRRRRARWALAVGVVLLVAAIGTGIAWLRGWRPGFMTPHVPVLAVLPPRNTSQDPEQTSYLAEGLGEELGSRLAQVEGIRVLPWITTQRFAPDSSRSLTRIARELRADMLLACTYRSDGERIRVNVALVGGRDGTQRWSNVFEENVEDLFDIQRAISLGVASQFSRKLSSPEREHLAMAPSRSPDAYEFFLRGAAFLHSTDPSEQALAESHFQKAVDLDSTLAEAYVGLGAVLTDRYFRGDLGGARNLDLAEHHFRRALRINPRLGAAERGLIRVYEERGPTEEELKIAQAASRRSPDDVDAQLTAAFGYMQGGLALDAVSLFARVLKLDPASAAGAWYLTIALNWAGRLEESLEAGKAYIRRFDEDPEVYLWMGVSAHGLERRSEACQYYERAMTLYGENITYAAMPLASLYRQDGETEKMRSLCSKVAASLERRLAAFPDNLRLRSDLAVTYAMLGDRVRYREQFQILSEAFAKPLPAAGGDNNYIPLALAQGGDVAGALEALRVLRGESSWWVPVVDHATLEHVMTGGQVKELLARPEWKSFVASVESEMARRRALYAPTNPLAGQQR